MQLYSLQFVVFLAVSLVGYYVVGRVRPAWQWAVLLVASIGFYAASGWQNLVFVLLTAATTWGAALVFARIEQQAKDARKATKDRSEKKAIKARATSRKRLVLLAVLLLNFGVLAYIKYWNTILGFFDAQNGPLACKLLLPLGLSFYTFQAVGYLIDSYNAKYDPQRNFAKHLLFVSFFPQLIQGPINRYDALAPQFTQEHHPEALASKRATLLIGYGLLKKYAVAEMLTASISACLDSITPGTPGSVIVFGILLYSIQQYADFSGGIDMVLGISELFGIHMAQNFRQPYFSISLGDFWRRWHMSLGAWMRDYVFYPFALTKPMQRLGKWAGKHGGKHLGRTLPASVANILVFFLVGLWHGAEAHYLWWGLYNGFVIALADLTSPLSVAVLARFKIKPESRGWHAFRVLRTFIVVNIGWYFDRIDDPAACLTAFGNTLTHFSPDLLVSTFVSFDVLNVAKCFAVAAVACVIVLTVSVLAEGGHDVWGDLLARNVVVRYTLYTLVALLVLCAFMVAPTTGGFLYANF